MHPRTHHELEALPPEARAAAEAAIARSAACLATPEGQAQEESIRSTPWPAPSTSGCRGC